MSFQIYYSINILRFDATGQRYELPTVFVNEPYSLCVMLVSNGNYFPSASFSCYCCRYHHHHYRCCGFYYCCNCCVAIITNIILFPSFFLAACNILFYFYSATQSAYMNSETSFQSFINYINMKWLPPILKSLEIYFRKNRRSKKTTEYTQMNS